MIYRYVCMICHFVFHTVKPYEYYECPSCHKTVQALLYVEEEEEKDVVKNKATFN